VSYRTLEVVIEDGRIISSDPEALPAKAHGLLTLLDERTATPAKTCAELAEWWSKRERLPVDEAEAFANDVEEARAKLQPLKSPWD
jgi:hypothetical protein